MPKNTHHTTGRSRRIVAHGVLKDTPDVRNLARAAIRLALADAQREAEAQRLTDQHPDTSRRTRTTTPPQNTKPKKGDAS